MKRRFRYAIGSALGGALGAALFDPNPDRLPVLRRDFPPDLTFALHAAGISEAVGAVGAAAIMGLAAAFAADAGFVSLVLCLFNPIALYAIALGAPAALYFVALFLAARALTAASGTTAPGPVVAVGLAAGAGPFLNNATLAAMPILIGAACVLFAGIRTDARKIAGVLTALSAPLAMALLSAGYLVWLFQSPAGVALANAPRLAPGECAIVAIGAALVGAAAGLRSRLALAGAAILAGLALFMIRPETLVSAATHIAAQAPRP
ncbi:MAG: hypothetical protein GC153_04890 [Alphaproteobacteria bacterium]|nr:hypothetical protein [Alphaproteobacteria bacterium]